MRRYAGVQPLPDSVLYAWLSLGNSVYLNNVGIDGSIMVYRPGLNREQDVSFV
jgi:hypothetical protein